MHRMTRSAVAAATKASALASSSTARLAPLSTTAAAATAVAAAGAGATMWGSVAATAALAAAALLLSGSVDTEAPKVEVPPARPVAALDPTAFKPLRVTAVKHLSADTVHLTLAYPSATADSGGDVASVVMVKHPELNAEGKVVAKPYTPVSSPRQQGTMELVVKAYPTGSVSKYLGGVGVGDAVEVKGPFTKFKYAPNTWSAVGLVAGGTGITPMYQLITEILSNPRDRTAIRLIYASRTPDDILLKAELDALAAKHPQFKVIYTVDSVPAGKTWKGKVGYVTPELVTSFLPPPQAKAGAHRIMVCGPPPMMRLLSGEKVSPTDQGELTGMLADLHYTKDTVFKY